jgi:hypothetical protein
MVSEVQQWEVIGMASAQLAEEGWKHHDKAYLNIIDTLHYVIHCKKDIITIFEIIGSLQMPLLSISNPTAKQVILVF